MIRKNITYAMFTNDAWLEKPVIDFLFGESPDLEFLLKAGQYQGAEGLRYVIDAMRRRGTATGGIMTWDFNEPWTNGAGSYLIDYDGRPLMNSAFVKQAADQLSLSLRHTSSLYNIRSGIQTTLYLSSDADITINDFRWSWKARDRRGKIISSGKGIVGINPIEVKKLADITVKLPRETAFGPVLIELQLADPKGKIIHERVHIFGLGGVRSPLKGLLADNLLDPDDDPMMLEQLLDRTDKSGSKKKPMPEISRPIKQTSLRVESGEPRIEGEEEVLELELTNTGRMTALFCEPRPVLNYRTDMIIENIYVSIPPGESRTMKIRAPLVSKEGLTLSQTGWRVESWNANPVVIKSSKSILLALGREDRMCREFAGYPGLTPAITDSLISVEGRQPDPGKVPYLLDESKTIEFRFKGEILSPSQEAILRIHTSDQSTTGAIAKVEINGKSFELQVPEGYGFQKSDPSHLAKSESIEMTIPKSILKQEDNLLRIKVIGGGWFTWDALDLRLYISKN
jgi:beta-mannosidase